MKQVDLDCQLTLTKDLIERNYMNRISEMDIVPINFDYLQDLEADVVDNVRLFKLNSIGYTQDESIEDKWSAVFSTMSDYSGEDYDLTLFFLIESDGERNNLYFGLRNNEENLARKKSTYSLSDSFERALKGNFARVGIENKTRKEIECLSNKISSKRYVRSLSMIPSKKDLSSKKNVEFVQGIEKFTNAMSEKKYIVMVVAQYQSNSELDSLKNVYDNISSNLSSFEKEQTTIGKSSTISRTQKFSEMNKNQRLAMIGGALTSIGGIVAGMTLGGDIEGIGQVGGAVVGGQVFGQLAQFVNSLAPREQYSDTDSETHSQTRENTFVKELRAKINKERDRLDSIGQYGVWNVASYFLSDDSSAENAVNQYRAIMTGEKTGNIPVYISELPSNATEYLARFAHPQFYYVQHDNKGVAVTSTTPVGSNELSLFMGLPRESILGFDVKKIVKFGKEVRLKEGEILIKKDGICIGKVYDNGVLTNRDVILKMDTLTEHVFIAGSSGTGKSNTICKMLTELNNEDIKFLVIEPVKSEYKYELGILTNGKVYGANPKETLMLKLNPFKIPKDIFVHEHIDGLCSVLNSSWSKSANMRGVLNTAVQNAYKSKGWNMNDMVGTDEIREFPSISDVKREVKEYVNKSEFSEDNRRDYNAALITRLENLEGSPYADIFAGRDDEDIALFYENAIIDIGTISDKETRGLIIGVLMLKLREVRKGAGGGNRKLWHVTIFEEAHNFLKKADMSVDSQSENSFGNMSEMISNALKEIRTYGEGLIIADQEPSSLNESVIKETGTKIFLSIPDGKDREIVGSAIGLSSEQIEYMNNMVTGEAVVWQRGWNEPVLCRIDKADTKKCTEFITQEKVDAPKITEAKRQILRALISDGCDATSYVDNVEGLLNLDVSGKNVIIKSCRLSNDVSNICDAVILLFGIDKLIVTGQVYNEQDAMNVLRKIDFDFDEHSKEKVVECILYKFGRNGKE